MTTPTLRRPQPQRWTELNRTSDSDEPSAAEGATQLIWKIYLSEEELRDGRFTGEDLASNWAQAIERTNASWQVWTQLPEAIEEDLKRISSLPAGWDGRSRSAVAPFTMERTRYFLRLAYSWSRSGLPEPFIGPGPDGRIVLEWEAENGKELIVDVPNAREAPIRFLLVEPTETGEELQIESEFSDKWSTQAIVTRLMAKPPTANS